ncbi:hypothetical protein [Myxosarcina sp. GI1(2024)]
MTRYILLGIVAVALFAIAPYMSLARKPSLASPKARVELNGIFDEVAEAGEKIGRIDEKAETVRDSGEEFMDDVREEWEE